MKATDTQTKSPEDYLKEPYARVLIPEAEGGFSAEILEFPGCYSYGDTREETLQNLEDAAFNWIEAALTQGQTIPEPFASIEYSGKYLLRMPLSLHRKASQLAQRDKVSLNTFFVEAISARVASKELVDDLRSEVRQLFQELEQRLTKQTAQHGYRIAASMANFWEQALNTQSGGVVPPPPYQRIQLTAEAISTGEAPASFGDLLSLIQRQTEM